MRHDGAPGISGERTAAGAQSAGAAHLRRASSGDDNPPAHDPPAHDDAPDPAMTVASGHAAVRDEVRRGLSLESSVFLSQLLLGAGVLLLVVIDFVVTGQTAEPLYFAGVAAIVGLTTIAAVVPWSRVPRWMIACVPLLDLVAIILTREGRDELGSSVLMVFPVIWLATNFGIWGAVVGPVFSFALLWATTIPEFTGITGDALPRLVVVPIVLAFVSMSSYLTVRRTRAQRVLLDRQAVMLEEALSRAKRQERMLDEILNAVNFGVVAVDSLNRPLIVNRAYREWMQLVAVEPRQIVPAVVYAEDRVTVIDEDDRPYNRLLRGQTFEDELVWAGQPGYPQRALAVTGRQLHDERGNREGAVLISRDVTELSESIRARDDLVASVSHELRTPLTSLLGYLELVHDDVTLSDQTKRHVHIASKNADRLLAIVSDFLAAKSDGGQLQMSFSDCDIAAIARQAVQSFEPLAKQRSITLGFAARDDTTVRADAFRVRQIIDNLLSNAIKYNNDGGEVSVRVTSNETQIAVRVSDTGRGMAEKEQDRVFERFYRSEEVRGTSIHGTGLGLPISRDMARQHDGELSLESSGPHGTTMVLTLPRISHNDGAHRDA
ncbi:sensor histidine kinase [Okibacterium endophyticum]